MSQPKLLDTPLYSLLHKDDVRGFNQGASERRRYRHARRRLPWA